MTTTKKKTGGRSVNKEPCCLHGITAGHHGLTCIARKDFSKVRTNLHHYLKQKFVKSRHKNHLTELSKKVEKCAENERLKRIFRKCCIRTQVKSGRIKNPEYRT